MADVLVERESFLAALRGLLAEARDGDGRLVFLSGEAGVGKTALAPDAEAAARVHKEAHGLVADEICQVTEGS